MHKIILLFSLLALSYSQQAEITNIQAAQRTDGSQMVDIEYDITADDVFTFFNVSAQVSLDGGGSYENILYVTGDIGSGIVAGEGKNIVWIFGQQFDETYSDQVKIQISATSNAIIVSDSLSVPFEMITIESGEFTFGPNNQIRNLDYDYDIMKFDVTDYDYVVYLIDILEGEETSETPEDCIDMTNPDGTPWTDGYPDDPWGCITYSQLGCFDGCYDEEEDEICSGDDCPCLEVWEACCLCGGGLSYEGGYVLNEEGIFGNYPGDAQYPAGVYLFLDFSQSKISHNGDIFEVEEGYVDHPVTGVTWFGGWHFAMHYGLQLPNDMEWEKAARGTTGYDYPWGDEISIYNANYDMNYVEFGFHNTTPVGFFNGQTYSYNSDNNLTRDITFLFQLDQYGEGDNYFTLMYEGVILYNEISMGDPSLEYLDTGGAGSKTVTYSLLPGNYDIYLGELFGDGVFTVTISYSDTQEIIDSFTLYGVGSPSGELFEFTVSSYQANRDDITLIDSPSTYGLYDMAGNVGQWLDKSPLNLLANTKGGSWLDNQFALMSWEEEAKDVNTGYVNVGFRCIKPVSVNLNRNLREMLEEHKRRQRLHRKMPMHPSERKIDGN